jgi:hypothetical protein
VLDGQLYLVHFDGDFQVLAADDMEAMAAIEELRKVLDSGRVCPISPKDQKPSITLANVNSVDWARPDKE